MPHLTAPFTLCEGPHSVCGVCFSLNLNKSTSYLSLCLSLNSFCDETSKTWASLGPKTRYHGFSCVQVPATWIQVPVWGKQLHNRHIYLPKTLKGLYSQGKGDTEVIDVIVAQLCPTLCNPMDHRLPDSFVHGILQARILEWVTIHSLLQGIFPTQGSNLDLLHCRLILYHLSHERSLRQKYIGTQNFTTKICVNYLGGLKLQARNLFQSGSVYIMPAETKAKTFCRRYLYLRPD